jgi:glycosyltransferase involved in cell wall biosynthesis
MNKKVLIANSHIPWGGLGQYSINLSKVLAKKSFEVYGLVTHNKEDLYNDFSESTIRTYYIGDLPKVRKYIQCIRIIKKLRPDYIFINNLATIHFVLPFIRNAKIISVIHSDQEEFYRIASINKSYIHKWIAPTPKIKIGFFDYVKHSIPEREIKIIPHGVDVGSLCSDEINLGTFNIAFVGALYYHKGVESLPKIFSDFHKECQDSRLTIIGDGDLKDKLKEDFISFKLDQFVSILGVIPNSEVRNKLREIDVLLFPTRVESFGIVIAEAMIEGVVPIVSMLEGITDMIVLDGESGFLVDKDDTDGFVDKLKVLYHDRGLLNKMSISAMIMSREEFAINKMGAKYKEMLLEL